MSVSSTDESFLKRWFEERDAAAFKVLCTRHAGMVYATCVRILRNETEAEDVTQSCFESLSELGKCPRGPLGPWLHRVATNRALNVIKLDKRRKAREERFGQGRKLHTEILWEDVYGLVDEAIEGLSEKLRVAVVGHFIEDETHESIARREGVSRAAITQRIQRGIHGIRKTLKRRGIPVSSAALGTMLASAKTLAVPPSLTASLGKLALAGAASAPSASTATMLSNLTSSRIGVYLTVALPIAAAAWWGGTAFLPGNEEPVEAIAVAADTSTEVTPGASIASDSGYSENDEALNSKDPVSSPLSIELPDRRSDGAVAVPGFPILELNCWVRVSPGGRFVLVKGGYMNSEVVIFDTETQEWLPPIRRRNSLWSCAWIDEKSFVYKEFGVQDTLGTIRNVLTGKEEALPVPPWLNMQGRMFLQTPAPVRKGRFFLVNVMDYDRKTSNLYLMTPDGELVRDIAEGLAPFESDTRGYTFPSLSTNASGSKVLAHIRSFDKAKHKLLLFEFDEDGSHTESYVDAPEVLSEDSRRDFELTPDGDAFLFAYRTKTWQEVSRYDLESKTITQLTTGGGMGGSMGSAGTIYFISRHKDGEVPQLLRLPLAVTSKTGFVSLQQTVGGGAMTGQ